MKHLDLEPRKWTSEATGHKVHNRDRLISAMLQERNVLRLVSAPQGYGKTYLMAEYVRRMFSPSEVLWIDGASPDFIRALDEEAIESLGPGDLGTPKLIVVDDLPILDEQRSASFAAFVEGMLVEDVEVIVATLPSCDFLRDSVPDRLLLNSSDLIVSERDVLSASLGDTDAERSAAVDMWNKASATLFAMAPGSVWGADFDVSDCLTRFFEEKLPMELFTAAFAILLLGRGSVTDLERMGIRLRAETELMMARDYLFLGIDAVHREFHVGSFAMADLQAALAASGLDEALLKGGFPVHEKAIGVLLDAGDAQRAGRIIDTFCSGERCEAWLRDRGWRLADSGDVKLLDNLFARCRELVMESDVQLEALRAWHCGLVGEEREAAYYARRILGRADGLNQGAQGCHSKLMAYLALLAFGDGAPTIYAKGSYAPSEISKPADFLAAVIDLCSDDELERGFEALKGNFAPVPSSGRKGLVAVEPEREEAMERLVTAYADRFQGFAEFRFALHMLAGVNSARVRAMVCDVGCGVIITMRKHGIKTYTQAVLLADLWRSGYFGISGRAADARDSKLLASASSLLARLVRNSGREPGAIPWDAGVSSIEILSEPASKRRSRAKLERVPVASVTLFGGLEVTVGEKYIPEAKWTRRALQLFAILVMHQGKDVSRDTIFQEIWPDLSRTRAMDNFYTAWSRMQALLGEGPYLARRGEFCCINTRYVSSDIAEFDQLAKRLLVEREDLSVILDIYARMESLYRGGILPSEVGNEFIESQRERYRGIYVDSMVAAVHKSLEARDTSIAMWFARKAMDEDPKREDVFHAMIRAQIAAGQRCSAIRTYFKCREYLREELGLDPSAKTQRLYDQLIASDPSLLKLESGEYAS